MKNKWIIPAGVVLALGALVATAAAHRDGKMQGRGMRGFVQALDLSVKQEAQLKDLRRAHRDQVEAALGQGHQARKTLRDEHIAAVEKTLNEEQREQFAEIRAEFGDRYWGGKMRGHRGHDNRGWGGRGHRARDAFGQLDLSDAQKAQLQGFRRAHRVEMGKLRKEHREAVESVLTAEQREKLEELKSEAFYEGKHRHRLR